MKHIALLLAALALGLGGVAAHADAEKGFYVGVGVGQFNLEIDNLDEAGDAVRDFDEDDTSAKVFAGWRFGPFFALELDYIDFGGPSTETAEVEVKGFAPYLVGTLPLGIFELFAQVGYYFYDFDVSENSANGRDFSDSAEDFAYGAGAGLVLFEHLDVPTPI